MADPQDLQIPKNTPTPMAECATFFSTKRHARLTEECISQSLHKIKKIAQRLGLESENDVLRQTLKGNSKTIAAIESLLLRPHPQFFEGAGMYKAFENTLLPQLINQNSARKKISIWVPGCAEGHEAYSIALLLNAHRDELQGWDISVLATDTDSTLLDQAETATFDKDEIDEVIYDLYGEGLKKNGDEYIVRSAVRDLITFQRDNFYDSESPKKNYDAIIFRDQLKNWHPDFQEKIIKNLESRLQPHAYLVLSYGESLMGLSGKFKLFSNTQGLYQKLY